MADSTGGTLHSILETRAPLPPEQAIPMVIELTNVLEVRHKQGKVLGGIYPDQVLFEDGFVQLYELAAPRLPEDLTIMYLGFVPPEILDNQPAVPQSDIYSVGVILYSLLTGHFPFPGGSSDELIENIKQSKFEEFPKLTNFSQLEWIIKKCLVKVPSRRYGSAAEIGQELRKILKPGRASQASPGLGATAPTTVKKFQRRGRDIQNLLLEYWKYAAAAAVLALIVIIVITMRPVKREVKHGSKTWRTARLTSTALVEKDAALSPDGRTIAFVSNATANWELYVRSANGGMPAQVTQSPGIESNPRWSPDGDLILFGYEGPGIQPSIFSVPPSGGIPQKIAENAVDGQWSPDGKRVCYVTPAQPGVRSLEVFEIQALQSKPVLSDIQGLANPSFSGDGSDLVCEADSDSGHRLFILQTKTGKMNPVGNVEGYSPTWQWSSGWIYYNAPKDGKMKIWRTDPDGFAQQVTEGPDQDFHPVPSFNGNSVLFYRQDLLRDIYSLTSDAPRGVEMSPIPGESSYPRYASPSALVFVRVQEGRTRLEKALLNSKSSSVLLDPILPDTRFSITSDGSYVHIENPEEGKNGVWEIALSGGSQINLGDQLILPYEMSPDKKLLLYGAKTNEGSHYLLKDLKTGEEKEILALPAGQRLERGAWLDRGASFAYLTSANELFVYSVKSGEATKVLTGCYDFAARARSDEIAAIAGSGPKQNSLILLDYKRQKRRSLTSFDSEAYARTIDWSSDGKTIYYDRMKTNSDLYSTE